MTADSVQQGERARMWSARRTFSDEEWERLNAEMDAIYADFVGKVAAGRGRSFAEIEPIARGRVWTGRDAYEIGLVDDLGGLRDAARIARRLADLPDDAPLSRRCTCRCRLGSANRATAMTRGPCSPPRCRRCGDLSGLARAGRRRAADDRRPAALT